MIAEKDCAYVEVGTILILDVDPDTCGISADTGLRRGDLLKVVRISDSGTSFRCDVITGGNSGDYWGFSNSWVSFPPGILYRSTDLLNVHTSASRDF